MVAVVVSYFGLQLDAQATPPPVWLCPPAATPYQVATTNATIKEGPVVGIDTGLVGSASAAVSINTLGSTSPRFAVAVESLSYTATGSGGEYAADEILVSRFMTDGTCAGPIGSISGIYRIGGKMNQHHQASIAMSASGQTRVGWGGLYFITGLSGPFTAAPSLLISDFAITTSPAGWPMRYPPIDPLDATSDYECSVGVATSPSLTHAVGCLGAMSGGDGPDRIGKADDALL